MDFVLILYSIQFLKLNTLSMSEKTYRRRRMCIVQWYQNVLQQRVLPVLGHVSVRVGLALLGLGVVNGRLAVRALLLDEEFLGLESCDTTSSWRRSV